MSIPKHHIGQWRSIEFELIFKSPKYLDEFKTFAKNKSYTKFISYHLDGSIHPNETRCGKCKGCIRITTLYGASYFSGRCQAELTQEIAVSYRSGAEQIIYDVCKFLKDKAYVNKSCGTHVHFDMRHVDRNIVRVYGARLACAVPALKMLLPEWRRKSEFAKSTISHLGDSRFDYGDRYAFVNLCAYLKHKTIEVRGHSGTIDADTILNWIALCEKVMFSEKTISSNTPKDLKKNYKLGKELSAYINKRAKQVKPKTFAEL
jgi:hypothetical protein